MIKFIALTFVALALMSYFYRPKDVDLVDWIKMISGASMPFIMIFLMTRRRTSEESHANTSKKIAEEDRQVFRNVGSGHLSQKRPPLPIDYSGDPILNARKTLDEDLENLKNPKIKKE